MTEGLFAVLGALVGAAGAWIAVELVVRFGAGFGAITHNERAGQSQAELLGAAARLDGLLNEISDRCRASIQESRRGLSGVVITWPGKRVEGVITGLVASSRP
jgi:hypothetical protein